MKNAVRKAQEKVRLEIAKKDIMWGRIAKAVDDAMGIDTPGDIEAHHINHIMNAILDFALPKAQLVEKTSQKRRMKRRTASHKKLQAQLNPMKQFSFQRGKAPGQL